MPWKNTTEEQQRWQFVCAVQAGRHRFAELCRQWRISRKTGYKWWGRFRRHGGAGLRERRRRPRQLQQWAGCWGLRLMRQRRLHHTWGARKLRWALRQAWPRCRLPSARTLHRWLQTAGLTRPGRHRARPGPKVRVGAPKRARGPNDLWTVDFKGRAPGGDGTRIEPLTVRDRATCFGLAVCQLAATDEATTRRAMIRIFRRYGLPRAIHVDNGPPFGGQGPLGLTRLTTWWLRLGVQVHFSRPGRPGDNAAHEQWHAVLNAECFEPLAFSVAAQQRRFARFRWRYNTRRPHEKLHMQTPASRYRRSARAYPAVIPASVYPAHWSRLCVGAKGYVWWADRSRLIGRAFAHQHIGLRPRGPGRWHIYLDRHLLGCLVASDRAGLRPVQLLRPPKP